MTFRPEYYSLGEAVALLGKHFRATAGYANVPPGTIGTVVGMYKAMNGPPQAFGLTVMWHRVDPIPHLEVQTVALSKAIRAGPSSVQTDGFSRLDMETVFTDGDLEGKRAMEPVEARTIVYEAFSEEPQNAREAFRAALHYVREANVYANGDPDKFETYFVEAVESAEHFLALARQMA